MSPLFTPQGSRAKWEMLYDIFSAKEVKDVVTYAEMGRALGSGHSRPQVQAIVHQVAPRLLIQEKKAIRAIPNVGYEIVEASQHLDLAKGHEGRASKALGRASTVVLHTDHEGLSEAQRAALIRAGGLLAAQQEAIRRLDIRQKRTDRAVASVAQEQAVQSDEIQRLRERIARLEQQNQEDPLDEG